MTQEKGRQKGQRGERGSLQEPRFWKGGWGKDPEQKQRDWPLVDAEDTGSDARELENVMVSNEETVFCELEARSLGEDGLQEVWGQRRKGETVILESEKLNIPQVCSKVPR